MRVLNLRKIDVVKLGILSAIFYFILGLFVVLVYGAIGAAFVSRWRPPIIALGAVLIVFIPIFYGIIGFVAGLVGGLLLNLSLSVIKGLPIYFDDEKTEQIKEEKNEVQTS